MKQKQLLNVMVLLLPTTGLISLLVWVQVTEVVNQERHVGLQMRNIKVMPLVNLTSSKPTRKPQQIGAEYLKLFNNALVAGTVRPNKVKFTFGISCIQRQENKTYIFDTIDSLFKHSTQKEQEQINVVILLADFAKDAKNNLSRSLLHKYRRHFESGLLRTIQAPPTFYPDLDHLKQTYDHPMVRVKWRSKQNYDFAFLMLYSRNLSTYYLQLEDDVTTVPRYVELMSNFIAGQKNFTCLEFSDLGFIAKLFHTSDLEKLARMLMLFFNEQPNDVTYLHFNELMLQFKRIVRKPTLFQHHGYFSSLSIKRENITDIYFPSSEEEKEPLPVQRRSSAGIRGPEEEVYQERYREMQKLKNLKSKAGIPQTTQKSPTKKH